MKRYNIPSGTTNTTDIREIMSISTNEFPSWMEVLWIGDMWAIGLYPPEQGKYIPKTISAKLHAELDQQR
jgi:hypothetical protein